MGIVFSNLIPCRTVALLQQTNNFNLSESSMDRREFVSGTALTINSTDVPSDLMIRMVIRPQQCPRTCSFCW